MTKGFHSTPDVAQRKDGKITVLKLGLTVLSHCALCRLMTFRKSETAELKAIVEGDINKVAHNKPDAVAGNI